VWNWQSMRGVPISGPPAGTATATVGAIYNIGGVQAVQLPASDGRGPTIASQNALQLTIVPATNQFGVAVSFGGVVAPTISQAQLKNTTFAANSKLAGSAIALGLPTLSTGSGVQMVMLRGQVGAPYIIQSVSFLFGQVIPPPITDETGTNSVQGLAQAYWLPEPYTTNNHAGDTFYWSPNAQQVFATQPGQVTITWRKATPATTAPTGAAYVQVGNYYYTLYPQTYLVSSTSVKPTVSIFWNQKAFGQVGSQVLVPAGTVNGVNVVTNTTFPQTVATEYLPPGSVPLTAGTTNQTLQELRTLWYDNTVGTINAYNFEGRAFVEYYGDLNPDGVTHHFLGFEIVDVHQKAPANIIPVNLGEALHAFAGSVDDQGLTPQPIYTPEFQREVYTFATGSSTQSRYWAIVEQPNTNHISLYWLQTASLGIQWPQLLNTYIQGWPTDIAAYSQFIRPAASTAAQAAATAIPLPTTESPQIVYQDPLDQTRSFLSASSQFYTWLTPAYPAQRTLLLFQQSGYIFFERVFSWLDGSIATGAITSSVATNLTAYNTTNSSLVFTNPATAPRVVYQNALVGRRINPPVGEMGAAGGTNYLAGFINQEVCTAFAVDAYIDPIAKGFDAANKGSIIPINAIPGNNVLEVLWFRTDAPPAAYGFKKIYWPSVIGYYTTAYDENAPRIILASNAGSRPLGGLQAAGHIYFQNDSTLPGYNPNEEHALMQGGSAWALRDDLNITSGPNYSSEPFVLLEYADTDGLPSMQTYKVVREDPANGITFDYTLSVGDNGGLAAVIQPPMPLPLLAHPAGANGTNVDHEITSVSVNGITSTTMKVSSPGSKSAITVGVATVTTDLIPPVRPYKTTVLTGRSGGDYVPNYWLLANSPDPTFWLLPSSVDPVAKTVTGFLSTNQPLAISPVDPNSQPSTAGHFRFIVPSGTTLPNNQNVLVANPLTSTNWVGSITGSGVLGLNNYVEINFGSSLPIGSDQSTILIAVYSGTVNPAAATTWALSSTLPRHNPNLVWTAQGVAYSTNSGFDVNSFTFQDRNGTLYAYRGPHDAMDTPRTFMRYYYETLSGFYFPQDVNGNPLTPATQPPVGTVTPYLRSFNLTAGTYAGDPIYGTAINPNGGDDNAYPVSYAPQWSQSVPTMDMAQTLTVATAGLPGVRGATSARILYQQSQVLKGDSAVTVVLHDPTRAKTFPLGASGGTTLSQIPPSVETENNLGKIYFPKLPPHLAERFYFDSSIGANGALVFDGIWKNPGTGEPYMLLNVLSSSDMNYLVGLCDSADLTPGATYQLWQSAIAGLTTAMVPFDYYQGRFYADPTNFLATTFGAGDLCQALNQEVPVDSYALTAVGPGTGYVVIALQDGSAFTPRGDPVTVQVVKVAPQLHIGDLAIVNSSNPLSQYLTLQQTVDLAGLGTNSYAFDWRISAPVNGANLPTYTAIPNVLLAANSVWNHVQFPTATDKVNTVFGLTNSAPNRIAADVQGAVTLIPKILINTNNSAPVVLAGGQYLDLTLTSPNQQFYGGENIALSGGITGTVNNLISGSGGQYRYQINNSPGATPIPAGYNPVELDENPVAGVPQGIVLNTFTVSGATLFSDLYLSVNLSPSVSAKVFIDTIPVATIHTGTTNDTVTSTPAADLQSLPLVYSLSPNIYNAGYTNSGQGTITHQVVVYLYASQGAVPGVALPFDLRLDAHAAVDQVTAVGSQWLPLDRTRYPDGVRATLGGAADVQALSDNWLTMRYTSTDPNNPTYGKWSRWTAPQLAEGWIKRVLAGVNPFNQRVTDLLNNSVNDQVSVLTQAGHRWEGNVALSQSALNNYGLIEIYETVLNIGRTLSIDAGINYGPADDALLLVAGYLSDLYTILGNEAWAEANNPTISIGTNSALGNITTALFPFMGETATLLEQEQDQLRGRDDFQVPGVEVQPVYNRLYWNYTRGINSGEIIYALNFDVKPAPSNNTGVVGAADAEYMFPQGHGDAYGHYLTALFNYYKLLMNPNFSWVPQPEAVTVLGTPVLVNYMHERKFAQSAAALAQSGQLIYDLTWRSEYVAGATNGWSQFSQFAINTNNVPARTRYWGSDHWACRVGQGEYLNWVVGNSMLPPVDPNPNDYGIQKVDRMTVPELQTLPKYAATLQNGMDNAEGHLNPLGLPENAVAFDINPNLVTGSSPQTHFEQVFQRAVVALNNAIYAFNQAQGVTDSLRNQQDTLADFVNQVNAQELSYTNQLIAIFGTPYSDDIGPGTSYPQGYAGPDLIHYMYVDQTDIPGTASTLGLSSDPFTPGTTQLAFLTETLPPSYLAWLSDPSKMYQQQQGQISVLEGGSSNGDVNNYLPPSLVGGNTGFSQTFLNSNVSFSLNNEGFISKPATWTGSRTYTGSVQQAIADYKLAWWQMYEAAINADNNIQNFVQQVGQYQAQVATFNQEFKNNTAISVLTDLNTAINATKEIVDAVLGATESSAVSLSQDAAEAVPKDEIVGLADGGDILAPARAAIDLTGTITKTVTETSQLIGDGIATATVAASEIAINGLELDNQVIEWSAELNNSLQEIIKSMNDFNNFISAIDIAARNLNTKYALVQTAVTQGNQLLAQREAYRAREAAIIQGFRSSDAAFRLFQNEKLERYNTLFDLAQRYAILAANAYDYETGQLGTQAGKALVQRMVGTRMLGIVDNNGNPQYAASDSQGDPGLSSAMAELWADWSALKGRLGFNNADGYGTVASLRTENFRINADSTGANAWQDLLSRSRTADLLSDPDIKQNCLQLDKGNGLPVPGIVIPFSTTIGQGLNLFGQTLAPGDHDFSESSFATKIYAIGVALEGYVGMDSPPTNGIASGGGNGATPTDPTVTFSDPNALAATPYVYLIPVGVDSMRSPPLGDQSAVRTWNVADIAVPMPFNLGESGYSTKPLWQSSDSLQEPLYAVRKHQAFRPVPSADYFNMSIYGVGGGLQPSQFTNRRLIGRSVWNSKWKLVIPGFTLLNDPNAGLDRLTATLRDVKLYFVTYSYAGN
jgi:hypothetical protein